MSGLFIDKVRIYVKGGDGGAGCMSFRREAHVPKGGPDGGDGGYGGNVILVADNSKSSLIDYRFKHHFVASRGTHGMGSRMSGKDGKNIILKVPVGTIVKELIDDCDAYYQSADLIQNANINLSNSTLLRSKVLADLNHVQDEFIVAFGGVGGRGNIHFVTPTRRAPEFAELGEPAQGKWIELEMKLLADAALVGMPSAGKSSLISRLSAAKPKIADYPFTTLTPNLGVAKAGDKSYVLADVPGLIEGASKGKGLGHQFLRHIERASIIVHIVDMSGSWENRDPVSDFKIINNELKKYNPELLERYQIVVANKCDLTDTQENYNRLQQYVDSLISDDTSSQNKLLIHPHVFCISAVSGLGLKELNYCIADNVYKHRSEYKLDSSNEPKYDKIWKVTRKKLNNNFSIIKLSDGVYEVQGQMPERAVVQTDLDNEEAVIFLQHRLKKMGVERALVAAGAKNGDEIRIVDRTFDFENTEAVDLHNEYGDLL